MVKISAVINMLASVALFTMMATVGLGVNLRDVLRVAGDWRLTSRAAIANFVLVPTIALGLLIVFRPAPMVAAGFLIAVVCPGAPFGPPLTALARGNVCASVGLMAILAGSSAIVAPLLLGALLPHLMTSSLLTASLAQGLAFAMPGVLALGAAVVPQLGWLTLSLQAALSAPAHLAAAMVSTPAPVPLLAQLSSSTSGAAGSTGAGALSIHPLKIVSTLMMTQFLPLCVGLAVRHFRPAKAEPLRLFFSRFSAVLNLLLIGLIVVVQWHMLETIRGPGYLGMAAMVASTLLVGWLFGGRDPVMRKTMAITTANRNVGVALVIASASFPGTAAVPAATAYALFQILALILISGAWGRMGTEEEVVEKVAA